MAVVLFIVARDLKSVSGKAFEKSVGKMCDIHHRLYNFRDDGTESEVQQNCFY